MSRPWHRRVVDDVLNPVYMDLDLRVRGANEALLALATRMGAQGVIRGCKNWPKRMWSRAAGLSPNDVNRVVFSRLATWCGIDGTDLSLVQYDLAGEERASARSESARKAAEAKHLADANALRTQNERTANADHSGHLEKKREEEKREEERRPPGTLLTLPLVETAAPKKRVPAPPPPSPDALAVAGYLVDAIQSHTPTFVGAADRWARDIDLAIRLDGATPERLRAAIDFAHRSRDTFWRPNLLSGSKLREKLHQLEISAARGSGGQRDVRVGPIAVTGREKYAGGEVKI